MRPALHVRKWRTDWNWDFVPWAARYWQCRTDSNEELDSVAWAQSNGWDLFHQENGSLSLSVCVEKVRAESPAQTSEISPSCRSIPFAANVLLFWSSRGNFSNEGPDDLWRRNCTYRQHLQFGYPSRDRISRAYAWLGQRIHDTHMLSFFFYHKKRDRITQNDVSFFSNGSHKSTSYCDHLNVLRVSNVCVREWWCMKCEGSWSMSCQTHMHGMGCPVQTQLHHRDPPTTDSLIHRLLVCHRLINDEDDGWWVWTALILGPPFPVGKPATLAWSFLKLRRRQVTWLTSLLLFTDISFTS